MNSDQVLNASGATYRQLDYWATTGRLAVIVVRLLGCGFTLNAAFHYGALAIEHGSIDVDDGTLTVREIHRPVSLVKR